MIIKNCVQILTIILIFFCSVNIFCGEKIVVKKETSLLHIAKDSGLFALKYTSPFFVINHISAVFNEKTKTNKNNVQPKDLLNLRKIGKSAYRTAPLTALVWYGRFMYDRSQIED